MSNESTHFASIGIAVSGVANVDRNAAVDPDESHGKEFRFNPAVDSQGVSVHVMVVVAPGNEGVCFAAGDDAHSGFVGCPGEWSEHVAVSEWFKEGTAAIGDFETADGESIRTDDPIDQLSASVLRVDRDDP